VATYVAALSRRQVLNAYNQTPAPWLPERLRRLAPLNQGRADPAALKELRQAGTRQVVVVNQPSVYRPGQWRSVVDQLVASGHFRVVASDGPLALLQLTDQ
jgi:collagenase-like PrtC family protease